jgi:hypothetical protein
VDKKTQPVIVTRRTTITGRKFLAKKIQPVIAG